jgi:hypothetical protein
MARRMSSCDDAANAGSTTNMAPYNVPSPSNDATAGRAEKKVKMLE